MSVGPVLLTAGDDREGKGGEERVAPLRGETSIGVIDDAVIGFEAEGDGGVEGEESMRSEQVS